jgi:hypothetical protein
MSGLTLLVLVAWNSIILLSPVVVAVVGLIIAFVKS